MPHITIDYTSNAQAAVEASGLADKLHATAHSLNVFPTNGVRTLVRSVENYRVGLARGNEAFIKVEVRVAPGRPEAAKATIAQQFFNTAEQALAEHFELQELGLQLEVTEFIDAQTLRRNSIRSA